MIFDGRQVVSDLDADVCVIGSGPGGVTFALELAATGLTIILIESGGEENDLETQSLSSGTNVGINYAPIEQTRSRFFGGSSNCWGGWCRPLDPIDFEERSWIANSGWPFGREALAPFYERARHYLRLQTSDYSEAAWERELRRKPLARFPPKTTLVTNQILQFSPPVRFGKTYRKAIKDASDLKLILMANVTEIDNSKEGGRPVAVHVSTLAGNSFTVNARSVVLAAGGIENARLLLLSRRSHSAGLGNQHDLVGRYFMDHPRVRSATISSSTLRSQFRQYDSRLMTIGHRSGRNPNKIAAHIAPTLAAQHDLRLPNSRSYLVGHYAFESSTLYRATFDWRAYRARNKKFGEIEERTEGAFVGDIFKGMVVSPHGAVGVLDHWSNLPVPSRRFTIETVIEPIPNYDSRVYLSQDKDRLGINKICLDWKLSDQDVANISATTKLVESELTRHRIGRVDQRYSNSWDGSVVGCYHHMGTTRMHDDPKRGVVDRNAKLHHHDGIYCLGSSVFPTVGNDCPTITLVALAIRLADWFKRDLDGVLLKA